MSQDQQKCLAAQAALDFIESGEIVGVGTGSTTNFFIDALAGVKGKIDGVVSSSEASADRLKAIGLPVLDLNRTGDLSLYVDGADEATAHLQLIKGGGGALARRLWPVPVGGLSASLTSLSCQIILDPFLCRSK